MFCLVGICDITLPRVGSVRLKDADRHYAFGNKELLLALRIW